MPLERLSLPQETLSQPNQMHCLHVSWMMKRNESMKNYEALTFMTWTTWQILSCVSEKMPKI